MKRIFYPLLTCITILVSCKKETKIKPETIEQEIVSNTVDFIEDIESAHNKSQFLKNNGIKFDIKVEFKGEDRFNAIIVTSTDSKYGVIILGNGNEIFIDNNQVYCSPSLAEQNNIKFDAYTWSNFLLFPYQLGGNNSWDLIQSTDDKLNAAKRINKNTLHAFNNWFILNSNKKTHILQHLVYDVNAINNAGASTKNAHAIEYLNYKNINEVPIAHKWYFWEWDDQKGLKKKIGTAWINNIEFLPDFKNNFTIPPRYIKK